MTIKTDYIPNQTLEDLADDLDYLNRRCRERGMRPEEIRAYLLGFTDAKLNRGPVRIEGPAAKLPTGVSLSVNGTRFVATLTVPRTNGTWGTKRVGTFSTPEEAHAAYRAAHIALHGSRSHYFSETEEHA